MAEYISREAVLEFVEPDARPFLAERIKSIPAADVRPVVRGKWKRVVDFTGVEAFGFKETMVVGWGCNVCGYEVDVSEGSFNFCPNCGADMREER